MRTAKNHQTYRLNLLSIPAQIPDLPLKIAPLGGRAKGEMPCCRWSEKPACEKYKRVTELEKGKGDGRSRLRVTVNTNQWYQLAVRTRTEWATMGSMLSLSLCTTTDLGEIEVMLMMGMEIKKGGHPS